MVYLHLRITTSNFTITQVEDFIKTLSIKYIVGNEKKPYNHFHCHFEYDTETLTNHFKRKLGKNIATHFGITGNKQYSLTIDKGKSDIYTLKEGLYVYSGYTSDEISELAKQSTSKEKYTDGLKRINDEYLESSHEYMDNDFKKYTEKYLSYMVDNQKNISRFRLETIFTTMFLRKHPNNIKKYNEWFQTIPSTVTRSYEHP